MVQQRACMGMPQGWESFALNPGAIQAHLGRGHSHPALAAALKGAETSPLASIDKSPPRLTETALGMETGQGRTHVYVVPLAAYTKCSFEVVLGEGRASMCVVHPHACLRVCVIALVVVVHRPCNCAEVLVELCSRGNFLPTLWYTGGSSDRMAPAATEEWGRRHHASFPRHPTVHSRVGASPWGQARLLDRTQRARPKTPHLRRHTTQDRRGPAPGPKMPGDPYRGGNLACPPATADFAMCARAIALL